MFWVIGVYNKSERSALSYARTCTATMVLMIYMILVLLPAYTDIVVQIAHACQYYEIDMSLPRLYKMMNEYIPNLWSKPTSVI